MPPLFLLKRHRMVLRLFCALVLIGCGYHAHAGSITHFSRTVSQSILCVVVASVIKMTLIRFY